MGDIRFPGDPPVLLGSKSAEDHKDWLVSQLKAIEDLQAITHRLYGSDDGVTEGSFSVSVTNPPSMTIDVASGTAIIDGIPLCIPDATELLSVAPSSNPRIDLVQVDLLGRCVSVKRGTEAPAPTAPAADQYAVPLWHVHHRVGETCIIASDDGASAYVANQRNMLSRSSATLSIMAAAETISPAEEDYLIIHEMLEDVTNRVQVGRVLSLTRKRHIGDLELISQAPTPYAIPQALASGNLDRGWLPDFFLPIVLTAQGGTPALTNGCADPAQVEAATSLTNYWALDFDKTTNETAWWTNMVLPRGFTAATNLAVRVHWTAGPSGVAGQAVKWQVGAVAVGDEVALSGATIPLANKVSVVDTLSAAGGVAHITSEFMVPISGSPNPGNPLFVMVTRDAAATEDTLDCDARLLAVHITYEARPTI